MQFVDLYKAGRPRSERVESERSRSFTYDDLLARDKVNLDLRWLKDDGLQDAADLPVSEVLAREIIEQHEAALDEFNVIAASLEELTDKSGELG